MARLKANRHEEVTGSLGGRSREGRGLDLDEVAVEEDVARDLVDLRSHAEGVACRLPAQVEIAVPQANLIADRHAIIDGERQGRRDREDLNLFGHHLDRSRRQVGVLVSGWAGSDRADDAQAVLVAQAMRDLRIVDDHLNDAARIP